MKLFKSSKTLIIAMTAFALFTTGCASDQKNTAKGAGIGAAAGALAGAIIGHQSGDRERGALIGAALGGGLGAVVGHRMDKQAKELEKVAETKRTEQGLVAKLKSDILFDTGKADLKPAAITNIKKMGEIMKKYPENVLTIKGHTDSTGSEAVNEALSLKRAEAVRAQLIASGVPATTVTTQGLGPKEPIADNKSTEGRKKNRRVEVEVTVDESKVPKS